MSDNNMEDSSSSVHSDDSNEASALKEKLEQFIAQESKHSQNYYDLHTRDSFTKLDVENINNSCQRYEEKIKKKNEILEERYYNLAQTRSKAAISLKEKMASVTEQLEQVNSLFCEAYEDYNSDVLRNTINYLDNETKQLERVSLKYAEDLKDCHLIIGKNLTTPKSNLTSAVDNAINLLFESSMKRPEIELEEINSKLSRHSIPVLKMQLQEMKSKPE